MNLKYYFIWWNSKKNVLEYILTLGFNIIKEGLKEKSYYEQFSSSFDQLKKAIKNNIFRNFVQYFSFSENNNSVFTKPIS